MIFIKFPLNETEVGKINLLERWIIVTSILYYTMNISLVSDYTFDMNCKQLLSLIINDNDSYKNSKYFYVFSSKEDFIWSGNTGYDLNSKLTVEDRLYFINRISSIISYRENIDKILTGYPINWKEMVLNGGIL